MKFPLIALAATAALTGSAYAQDYERAPPPAPPSASVPQPPANAADAPIPTFESLDRNADGQLTVSEAQADRTVSTNFSTLDRMGKGYVTKREYDAFAMRTVPKEPRS